ncbi:MAG TPA: hypothetical protein VMV10_16545 [Pirellulales bacterium]|nr:hypothetical protein [Pirellulales bacterium]
MFCLLPTAAIFGWSASRKSSQHLRSCELQLTEQLGLKAKLDSVSYPQPGVVLLHGLELCDLETDQPVFHSRSLEITRVEGRLVVLASEPVIEAGRLYQLWDLLGRRLRRELTAHEPIELLPCNLTIRSERGEQTYELVGGRLEPEESGEAAELRFRLPGLKMPEPASVRIVRDRQRQTPSTRFALSTGGAALPCSLFAALCDVEGTLGAAATFSGSLWADDTAQGWEAELAGRFEKIDLGRLVSNRFNHLLEGEATLELIDARFHESQLTEAHGSFAAGPGEIGVSLVQAAVAELGCSTDLDVRSLAARDHGTYERLAFGFGIGAEGLRLTGKCEGHPPGVMLAGGAYSSLLVKSADRLLSVVALLRVLSPTSQEQAPATSATRELIPWLPMPPVVRPRKAAGSASPPVVYLRLKVRE